MRSFIVGLLVLYHLYSRCVKSQAQYLGHKESTEGLPLLVWYNFGPCITKILSFLEQQIIVVTG